MWQLEGSVGQAVAGDLILSVDTASGQRQLVVKDSNGTLLATLWSLPGVDQQPVVDCYVRGDDLVCVLAPSEAFPFTTQLYWTLRTLDSTLKPTAAVTLSLSIRTELLDTEPAIAITCESGQSMIHTMALPTGPAYTLDLGDHGTLLDYAMTEDCAQQATTSDTTIERTLFGHFLEKGVIRTGRLHAVLVPGELDASQATALCDDLASSQLPLTT
ncbi:hypothetical protein [Aeoliella mucimassa]|uniref:Uncharacterized protein n=1 Tax=Aeoliella mucimassa TaxID=2527972 RepID=A0A518AWR7_9BACT|nr:hypothetical protein [Aeoliella mucimassa]QDU59163.1 hypothetical protein Pan181_54040 [Aeoliella mucimassa]